MTEADLEQQVARLQQTWTALELRTLVKSDLTTDDWVKIVERREPISLIVANFVDNAAALLMNAACALPDVRKISKRITLEVSDERVAFRSSNFPKKYREPILDIEETLKSLGKDFAGLGNILYCLRADPETEIELGKYTNTRTWDLHCDTL